MLRLYRRHDVLAITLLLAGLLAGELVLRSLVGGPIHSFSEPAWPT